MKHTITTLIATLLVAFVSASPSQAQRYLSYEPEVVELTGRLLVQSKYGPPNFGEQPKTDQRLRVPVLVLRDRVSLIPDNGDGPNAQYANNVRQIQLAFSGSETSHSALIGKQVVVKGTLFHAHTSHHFTDVVMKVESIERKPVGYDQKEFAVCRINTSEWYVKQNYGSSISSHAEFRSPVGEDEVLRSFKHAKSGLIINAGVQFKYVTNTKNARPHEIRIAISMSNKEEDALHTLDNAVAGTLYRRDWGSLYVTKQVVVGDIEHTFTLSCSDRHAKGYKNSR